MLCEEEFESVQLLWNALDVIETVDTNDDFHAAETLLKLSDAVDNGLLFEILRLKNGVNKGRSPHVML